MKKFLNKIHLAVALTTCVLLVNCSEPNIQSVLNLNCSEQAFENLNTSKEPRGYFEVPIPNHFKKEFFVNEFESRLYFADTTKQLSDAYIMDFGFYSATPTELNQPFIEKKILEYKNNTDVRLEVSEKIVFQGKTGHVLFSKKNDDFLPINSIEIYIPNTSNTYYYIKSDFYGNDNLESRICQALSLLELSKLP